MSFNFHKNTTFPGKLEFNKKLEYNRNISNTLCNHNVSTTTVCTCITYFVNVCKDDFYQPIFTHVSDNSCLYALALPKSKEKHCMGKVLDWDNRHFFPLYRQLTLFYLTNLYSAKKKQQSHMFNVECCKLHGRGSLKFFRGMLPNGHPGGFVFFGGGLPQRGLNFSWGM